MNREDTKTRRMGVLEKESLTAEQTKMEQIAAQIIDAALFVHKTMGPGLLESIYLRCLFAELRYRNISVLKEVSIPLRFRNEIFDEGFRMDLLVADQIVVELKAVEKLLPVHRAQTLSYMRLTNKELEFLINFNVPMIKEGIVRIVNRRDFASSGLRDSSFSDKVSNV